MSMEVLFKESALPADHPEILHILDTNYYDVFGNYYFYSKQQCILHNIYTILCSTES